MNQPIQQRLLLEATDRSDLVDKLLDINVVVPSRAAGRTKDHTEIYSIVRMLASLPPSAFRFPLTLVKDERPDFELRCDTVNIGIEHTEAISQNAAKEAALRDQGAGPRVYFVKRTLIDEQPKSRKDLLAEIEADVPGLPWMGDSMEREWAEAMVFFANKKLAVARQPGFKHFSLNWLLVYDNWPAVGLKRATAIAYLQTALNATEVWSAFDQIFVLDEAHLTCFLHNTEPKQYQVNACVKATR